MKKVNKCPICKQSIIGRPALSRKDSKTEICSGCAIKEALLIAMNYENSVKQNKAPVQKSSTN